MGNMKELYTELGEPITKAASWAANTWHGLMEAEEIESEIWIEILESDATLRDVRGADPGLLHDILSHKASRICLKARDSYEHFSGQYRYSVNEVKTVVEMFFLRSGEELVIDFVDVEVGFDRLSETNPNYARTIFRRYSLGEIPPTKSEEHFLSKGLTKLTDYMNKNFKDREREHRDGPGTRTPMARGYDSYEGN